MSEVGLDDSDANALHGGTAACLSVRNDFLSYPRLFWVDLKPFYTFIVQEISEIHLIQPRQIQEIHMDHEPNWSSIIGNVFEEPYKNLRAT